MHELATDEISSKRYPEYKVHNRCQCLMFVISLVYVHDEHFQSVSKRLTDPIGYLFGKFAAFVHQRHISEIGNDEFLFGCSA